MNMPQIENKITMGNILTIALLIFSIAVAWGALQTQMAQAETSIADHEARLRVLERDVVQGLSRIDERLSNMERSK